LHLEKKKTSLILSANLNCYISCQYNRGTKDTSEVAYIPKWSTWDYTQRNVDFHVQLITNWNCTSY